MSGKTYDPFAIERPRLKLGALGEWELGEMHDTRHAAFRTWHGKFLEKTEDADATIKDFAGIVGELVQVSCVNAEDAKEIIEDMCDPEFHGEETRGLQTLQGIVQFLADWANGELTAGEG